MSQDDRPAQLVQDSVEALAIQEGRADVPVRLHTLVVRMPGRVQAAMEFARLLLGARTFGAAGQGELSKDDDGDHAGTPEPTPELASARKAAFRTLENYFGGNINDELVVHADFRVKGRDHSVRFIGQIDGETGRVLDPKHAPQLAPNFPNAAEPSRQPGRNNQITIQRTAGPWVGQTAVITLPPGLIEDDIEAVEDSTRDYHRFRLTLRNGNKMTIDGRDGGIVE